MERKNLCLGSDYARLELGPGLGEVRRDVNSRSGPANKANEQGRPRGLGSFVKIEEEVGFKALASPNWSDNAI
jgi:hypothetical protein